MSDALPPLVDSHCHLAWPDFDADLAGVVERMHAAGVLQAVCVATDAASAEKARSIADRFAGMIATAGFHPNDVPRDFDAAWREVEAQLRSGRFGAVGETGLDYYRDPVPPELQRVSFDRHAQLARELDLPLIVHIRDRDGQLAAYDDVAQILADVAGVRGVIHCFTGDASHALRYLDLGMHISFSGVLTFKNADNVRAAAQVVPLERTLVETDAPFLSPEPYRKVRRCEPAFVAATARRLAALKGVAEAEVRAITTRNAQALFALPA